MKKKQLFIALMVIAVAGFIYATNLKYSYRILEERISNNKPYESKIEVEGGSKYIFSFWGVDEETGLQQWGDMELRFSVKTEKGTLIEENTLIGTKAEEEGGIRRAQNGDEVHYQASSSESIVVSAELVKGDYFDLEVYENIPEGIHLLPSLFIFMFLVSLVLFLRARNKA